MMPHQFEFFYDVKPKDMWRERRFLPVGGSTIIYTRDIGEAFDALLFNNGTNFKPDAIAVNPRFPESPVNFEFQVIPYSQLK